MVKTMGLKWFLKTLTLKHTVSRRLSLIKKAAALIYKVSLMVLLIK
jgi:hypothetical protein